MNKTTTFNSIERKLLITYIIWEICNIIAIKYVEYAGPYQMEWPIKYLAICVNTLITAYFYWKYGRRLGGWKGINLLAAGLFLTFIADFLLTLHGLRLPGFIAFCLVESVYAAFFKPTRKTILCTLIIFAILFILLFITGNFSFANIFGVLDISLLTVNVVSAFCFYKQKKVIWRLSLALGFALFAGCDYCIMLQSLATGSLYTFLYYMTWIFYVPAQFFIVLSYILAIKSYESDPL